MSTFEIISKRESCRDYQDKPFSKEDTNAVESIVRSSTLYHGDDVEILFRKDGKEISKVLEGVAGYSGHMIQAPQYLVVKALENSQARTSAGYTGERIILELLPYKVATCWITVDQPEEVAKRLGLPVDDKKVVGLIALGYAKSESFFSKFFGRAKAATGDYKEEGYADIAFLQLEKKSARGSTSDFIYLNQWGEGVTLEEIMDRGFGRVFQYMRFAPSYSNRQPWKFVLSHKDLTLCIEKTHDTATVNENLEAGIMMVYVEMGMNQLGYNGVWKVKEVKNTIGVPEEKYFIAGKYCFEGDTCES